MRKLGSFIVQCKRVWKILKKPSAYEFKSVSKVSAIGMLILGAGGFLISNIIKFVARTFG